MISFSKEHKEALRDMGVAALYLFGSRVSGTARDDSDYDIGVVFTDPETVAHDRLGTYLKVHALVSEYVPDGADGGRLDISFLQFANAALEMAAIDGIVLFEIDAAARVEYEEGVIKRYDDYRFLRSIYEEATFAAFAHA